MDETVQSRDKFIIRMPFGMRDRIRRRAEKEGRSMNAEVLQTLEAAYPPGSDVDEILLEIGKKCVAEIEEDDPDVLSRIQQEISDLYSVLKYERDLEMGYHDPLEIDERDHMAKE